MRKENNGYCTRCSQYFVRQRKSFFVTLASLSDKESIIWVLLAIGFFLLPVADIRPFSSLPLYPLDFVCFFILVFSFLFFRFLGVSRHLPRPFLIAVATIALSSLLSWWVNGATLTGLGQLKSWLFLPGAALFIAAATLRKSVLALEKLLRVWLAGLVGLLGVLLPFFLSGTFTFDGRFEGPFTSPNFLAFFLVPGVLLSYWHAKRATYWQYRFLFISLGLSFLFFLFYTRSFGAWLSLAASFAWYFFSTYRSEKTIQKGVLTFLVLGALFLVELGTNSKLENIFEERSSLYSRFTIWTVSLQALKDHPFAGIGIGRFQEVYLSYQPLFPPFLEWAVPQPHNIFLAVWLQMGILGFFAFLYLCFQALQKRAKEDQASLLLQALFVGFLVYGLFDTPLFGNGLSFVWWTAFAFLLLPQTLKKESP